MRSLTHAATAAVLFTTVSAAFAAPNVASKIFQEGEAGVPGLGSNTLETISGIDATLNGYVFRGLTSASTLNDIIYGTASGLNPGVIVQEQAFGTFAPTLFDSGVSINATGDVALSAGGGGVDSLIKNNTLIARDGDPSPDGGTYANFFKPKIDTAGNIYAQSATSAGTGIFVNNSTSLLRSGDAVGNSGGSTATGIVNSLFDISSSGNHYVTQTALSAGNSGVVVDDNAISVGGSIVGVGQPFLGNASRTWSVIRSAQINTSGNYVLTGDIGGSTADDEKLIVQIGAVTTTISEGATLPGAVAALSGTAPQTAINNDNDYAVTWGDGTLDYLIVNGRVVLKEGDLIDSDGDGVVNAGVTLAGIGGVGSDTSFAMGDRRVDGTFDVYFLGRGIGRHLDALHRAGAGVARAGRFRSARPAASARLRAWSVGFDA